MVGDETLGACSACGREMDEDGETVVPLGEDGSEGHVRVIHLTPGLGAMDATEMPESGFRFRAS